MAKFTHRPTTITAIRMQQTVELPNLPEHTRRGEPGDWLATDVNGQQYIIPDATFRKLYIPDDEEALSVFNLQFVR